MPAVKWVADLDTGKFLYGGFYEPDYDPETQIVIELEEHPDPTVERYDPTSKTLKRLVTQEELSAEVSKKLDGDALSAIDDSKALKAAIITSLWGRLGRQPTIQEIAAERSRFLTIYKAL